MDLLSLVVGRAEKWRRAATNIVLELPKTVHEINANCTGAGGESTDKPRFRLRDTLLAILLEGNLLEVKVPEWMFLYDFVHENFRKDRNDDPAESSAPAAAVRPMVLPIRTGRLPLAVDMISPLFREVSRSSATRPPVPVMAVEVDVPVVFAVAPRGNGMVKRPRRRADLIPNGPGVKAESPPPPPPPPVSPSVDQRMTRQRRTETPVEPVGNHTRTSRRAAAATAVVSSEGSSADSECSRFQYSFQNFFKMELIYGAFVFLWLS